MIIKEIILIITFIQFAKSDTKEASKRKNSLPYFRKQVEGIYENSTLESFTEDFSSNNLVSFLVKNAKEIFNDVTYGNEIVKTTTDIVNPDDISLNKENTHDVMLYENLTLTTLLDSNLIDPLTDKDDIEKTLKSELMQLTKEMKSFEKTDIKFLNDTALTSISSYILEATEKIEPIEPKRVCIFCNTLMNENCNDPQNKLIQSVTCKNEGDLCYSQHTPFGIIDRGCFSVNRNLTTYVCSCNLCNYMSIADMPFIFTNKQAWVDNIIELSRTRNFRNSVFKDMSCLRCEVNTTTKTGDMLDAANCMEGNVGNLPTQLCEDNEICGVKAIKSDGYVWRGCIAAPLYNYWWALCDTDLCNHDHLVSIYDYVT